MQGRTTLWLLLGVVTMISLVVGGIGGVAGAAGSYPERTIQFIVGWGPGGGTDVFARMISMPARTLLGVPLVVINMPGGTGAVANKFVQDQPADGYTIVNANPGLISNYLMGKDPYSYRDFVPVIRCQAEVGMLHVPSKSKFNTVQDVISYAKANPGKLTITGNGALSLDEIAIRLFADDAGINIKYVPFESASEMHAAFLGGHVDVMYEEPGVATELIESGQMRPILVFADKRLSQFPDVPCSKELGHSVPPGMWRGIAVKKGTPPEVVQKLHDVFKKAMEASVYVNYAKSSGLDLFPGYMSSEEFGKLWEQEDQLYKKVLKKLGQLKREG